MDIIHISYIMLVKSIVESTMFKQIDDYLWALCVIISGSVIPKKTEE